MHLGQIVGVFVLYVGIAVSVGAGKNWVVVQIGIFVQSRDGIDAKASHATIKPEAQHVVHRLPNLGIAPVQIGLFTVEIMVVILVGLGIELPGGVSKP